MLYSESFNFSLFRAISRVLHAQNHLSNALTKRTSFQKLKVFETNSAFRYQETLDRKLLSHLLGTDQDTGHKKDRLVWRQWRPEATVGWDDLTIDKRPDMLLSTSWSWTLDYKMDRHQLSVSEWLGVGISLLTFQSTFSILRARICYRLEHTRCMYKEECT
jgi:hypothetical protein